ncbi:MAG: nuclear transport factor 2 family protein [Deltaproteobacteria bacterium]|nr:nuclear transport factor 2 family protein [Deltaproteobacteria bacterium]
MKELSVAIGLTIISVMLCASAPKAGSEKTNKQQIIELEHGLIEATNTKHVDQMMSFYDGTDRLYIFDAIPPLKYAGTAAWRKNLEGFIAAYNPGILEITELQVVNDDKIGYAHSIQRFTGTDKNGKRVVMAFRVTDCLEKENGKWKIVHEHNSMPIDYASGKAFLNADL